MRAVDHDDLLFNKKKLKRDIETSELLNCITLAKDIRTFALYYDDPGRLYRPRVVLTEKANFGKKTNLEISEKFIYFDTYILPEPRAVESIKDKNKRVQVNENREKPVKVPRTEKAQPPHIGEKIKFKIKKFRAKDKESVKEFVGIVDEVYWGSVITLDSESGGVKEAESDNLGLIKVSVVGTYGRSLVVQPAFDIANHSSDIGL
jgi:hypothetical protein